MFSAVSVRQSIPGVCVYIDDILGAFREVLNCLTEAGMRLKKNKCAFLLPSIEYLGYVICAEGLKISKIFFKVGQLL